MDQSLRKVFTSHPRQFETFAYAYPVYSRRSQGISLGVNLNPDQLCNFDCPYCQVDRRVPKERREIDPERVVAELRELLARHAQDQLSSVFPGVPPARLVVRDVALSGDGEPTLSSQFAVVAEQLALLQAQWVECGGAPFSLVCITNATQLHTEKVRRGLGFLCQHQGEIWGKLDAGTQDFYQKVNVTRVPLEQVVDNLGQASRDFPLRIQTLFFNYQGLVPDAAELDAWIGRLHQIQKVGSPLGVQLHTVARATAAVGCSPLALEWLQALAHRVTQETGLAVECHAGAESGSFTTN